MPNPNERQAEGGHKSKRLRVEQKNSLFAAISDAGDAKQTFGEQANGDLPAIRGVDPPTEKNGDSPRLCAIDALGTVPIF